MMGKYNCQSILVVAHDTMPPGLTKMHPSAVVGWLTLKLLNIDCDSSEFSILISDMLYCYSFVDFRNFSFIDSRAMETVVKQHGLDIEALMSSRLPVSAVAQAGEAASSQVAGRMILVAL